MQESVTQALFGSKPMGIAVTLIVIFLLLSLIGGVSVAFYIYLFLGLILGLTFLVKKVFA